MAIFQSHIVQQKFPFKVWVSSQVGHTKFKEERLFKEQDYRILNTIIDQNEQKDAKIALQMLVLKSRKKPKFISQTQKYQPGKI